MFSGTSSMGLNIGRDLYCPEMMGVVGDRYKSSFNLSHFLGRIVGLQHGLLRVETKGLLSVALS